MEILTWEQLRLVCKGQQRVETANRLIKDMNLTNWDLHDLNFDLCAFENVILEDANLSGASFKNALLDGISLKGANLKNADLEGSCLRGGSLKNCDCRGVNFYSAVLEHTNLSGIVTDETTKWFEMHCPVEGPILGFKKCYDNRLVQLLIPADAKRTSATRPSCRCNKAKVLSIWNFDATISYDEAWSLVDDNFVYRKGQWVEVKDFNEDRWYDSTTGIHFWLSREEAIKY